MRRGHFFAPPRTELRFDATKPFEFAVYNFTELDNENPETVERWTLPVEMFKSLRILRGHGSSAGILNADIAVSVPKSLTSWRRQIFIDLDIKEGGSQRRQARLIISWRDIKRFMRLIEKILKEDPMAKTDYVDGVLIKFLGHS